SYMFILTGPVIIWSIIKFVLLFVFQGDTYAHKKQIDAVLLVAAILPLTLKPFNDRWFSLFYLIQFIISFICCVTVLIIQRKRVGFFLNFVWKNILPSFSVFIVAMFLYAAIFRNEPKYLANSGLFLIICLPLWSVFKVAFRNRKSIASHTQLSKFQRGVLLFAFSAFICGIAAITKQNMTFIVLTVQAVLWFFILYHIFLTLNAKKSKSQTEAWQNHLHAYEISRIEKEESLKNEFSNFLHDDVLQDLFSLKNLMEKSERPEVRELIGQTLENLNVLVREQMQEYHPVLLKSLSLKENYSNLLSAVSQKFQPHDMNMIFDCDNSLFLIMPYDVIIYRMIKVLSTNALKHSLGSSLRIILTQTGGLIDLTVKDNGNVSADIVQAALQNCKGKGLFSIQEQAALLGGQLIITENNPKGLCVRVVLPMKGEGSYEYFIGR
ncbi:MAG: hypothetical protein LBI03_02460, partial [Clostridiales bacterium]|nr:hypothetical protein [Clostridiales bacterium]